MALPPNMVLRSLVNEARTEVRIEFHADDRLVGWIALEAPELEDFIHQLAEHRASLADEVPKVLDPGTWFIAQIDPTWHVSRKKVEQGQALLLRHPGFGWLSFVLSNRQALKLAGMLTRGAQPKPEGP
jgi:hypothetical protein